MFGLKLNSYMKCIFYKILILKFEFNPIFMQVFAKKSINDL